jgi:hypothetical protein
MAHPLVLVPPPTVTQRYASLLNDVVTLAAAVDAALQLVDGYGRAGFAVDTAVVRLRSEHTAAQLPAADDQSLDERHRNTAVALAGELQHLADVIGRLPAMDQQQAADATALVHDAQAVAASILGIIATPLRPRRGVPSVGFEYEVKGIVVVGESMPPKTLLARWEPGPGEPGVRLEIDTNHVEFITEPATTLAEVRAQLNIIQQEVKLLSTKSTKVYKVREPIRSAVDGTVLHPAGHGVKVAYTTSGREGMVQGTAACALVDLPEMVVMHVDALGVGAVPDDPNHPQAVALARMVGYYVEALDSKEAAREQQGPKVLLPLMCRTGFRAMYLGMPQGERDQFKTLVGYGTPKAGERARRLISGGYLGPAGRRYKGRSVGAWMDRLHRGW